MADQEVHAAPTLTEMMRRRAALTPDAPYFYLYGDTITYGLLWEVSGRYAAGLARGGLRAGDKLCHIYPTCAEFFFRSEEHTSELQSHHDLVCRLLLEKKKTKS